MDDRKRNTTECQKGVILQSQSEYESGKYCIAREALKMQDTAKVPGYDKQMGWVNSCLKTLITLTT